MNLKEELENIKTEHNISYKEARQLLLSRVRKLYETNVISKAEWKNLKNYVKEQLK